MLPRACRLADALLQRDYIPQLVELFSTVEDLESAEELAHMFVIFKGVIMLNNTNVYEVLLREDMLMGVVGALEYDPELSCHQVRSRAPSSLEAAEAPPPTTCFCDHLLLCLGWLPSRLLL